MPRGYTSIEEFEKDFFPRAYEERLIKIMSPEELGKHIATQSLEKVRAKLERLTNSAST